MTAVTAHRIAVHAHAQMFGELRFHFLFQSLGANAEILNAGSIALRALREWFGFAVARMTHDTIAVFVKRQRDVAVRTTNGFAA